MAFKDELIKSIVANLKIEAGMFSLGMIEECIEDIPIEKYQDFFNMLMGDEHDYLKPLDRVAKVAKHFKHSKADELFSGTRDMAKAFYNKIYTVNASMTTYSQENRDKVPNDREFFENMDYSKLKDKDGFSVFTKQDLYILGEIGGGEWVMNIKFISNSDEAVLKIENIIKNAITAKYLSPKHETISHEVRRLLK